MLLMLSLKLVVVLLPCITHKEGLMLATQKKNITVRLGDEARELVELIAAKELRPVANQITYFIQQGIDIYLEQRGLVIYNDDEAGRRIVTQAEYEELTSLF